MQALQQNIEKETGVKVEDQDILLASGASPDPNLGANQCWTAPGEEDWVVFLFIKGENQAVKSQYNKPLPVNVQNIVKDSKTALPYNEQKRAWAEAVYFCNQQVVDFRRLIQSQRAAMLSLLRKNYSFVKMKNNMVSSCDHLLSKMQYFNECLDHDLSLYEIQKSTRMQYAEGVVAKWKRVGQEIEIHRNLKEKVTRLEQQSVALQTKIIELQKSPFACAKQNDVLEDSEKKAIALYHDMRQAGKNGSSRDIYKDHTSMVQIVVKCLITRDKSLEDLFTHLRKICACKHELFQLLPSIQQCCEQITEATQKLLQAHKQRQSDIWSLVQMAVQSEISRQDSKGSSSNNSWSVSSYESMKVCDDNRETVKKVDDMIVSVMREQEEHLSMMDWSFLPPAKESSS